MLGLGLAWCGNLNAGEYHRGGGWPGWLPIYLFRLFSVAFPLAFFRVLLLHNVLIVIPFASW